MRDYTKFFTLAETAAFMTEMLDPKKDLIYMEPSAGSGNLIRAVKNKQPNSIVYAVEKDKQWLKSLNEVADSVCIGDWLEYPGYANQFDGMIANPPFGNGIDLDAHVRKMIWCTKSESNMVILLPKDFSLSIPHNEYDLQNWGTNKDGSITPIKIVAFMNYK